MFGFSDLEERLMSKDGATVLTDTLARLDTMRGEVQAALDTGLSPGDHDAAERLLAALNASGRIMRDTSYKKGLT
ncbi:hypothetical protein [Pseudooceanicola aestuarii]|uniref:hypothetical protein n=1 Tax=Pseudooceanicola aestuarii TaxID=2697319 RepID=UPI0013D7EFE2|nr:hypothetical protein [Pseudooceanicola aestuarii]